MLWNISKWFPFSFYYWKYERITPLRPSQYLSWELGQTKVNGPTYNWVLLEFLMLTLAFSQPPIIHQLLFRFSYPSTGSAVFYLWTSGLVVETACILLEAEVCPVQLLTYQNRAATFKLPMCRTDNQKSLLVLVLFLLLYIIYAMKLCS